MIEFSQDEFHTGSYLEEEGLASTYYSDFPQEYKDKFVDYTHSVENITRASRAELKDAFDRLNRNVARLTKQELRHAMFEGVFISRMESMANGAFWKEIGLSTRANVSRMRDVEFVSELFLLTMHGVQDGKPSILDTYYAEYDSGIPPDLNEDRDKSPMAGMNAAPAARRPDKDFGPLVCGRSRFPAGNRGRESSASPASERDAVGLGKAILRIGE